MKKRTLFSAAVVAAAVAGRHPSDDAPTSCSATEQVSFKLVEKMTNLAFAEAPHMCPKLKLPMFCGACPSCDFEMCFREAKEWIVLCEDSAVRSLLVEMGRTYASADIRRTVAELNQQLRQKDLAYTAMLRDRVPRPLSRSSSAGSSILLRPRRSTKSSSESLVLSPRHVEAKHQELIAHGRNHLASWLARALPSAQVLMFTRLLEHCDRMVQLSVVATLHDEYGSVAKRPSNPFTLLPVHLVKYILSFFDPQELAAVTPVCVTWHKLVQDLVRDREQRLDAHDFLLDVQATGDPSLCRTVDVRLRDAAGKVITVPMLERNVYCGVYSVIALSVGPEPLRAVAYNGRRLAASSAGKALELWDTTTGKLLNTLTGHSGSLRVVVMATDDSCAFTSGFDTTIRQWKLSTGHCARVFQGHKDTVLCLAITPSGLLVSGAEDSSTGVWNVASGRLQCFLPAGAPVLCVAAGHAMFAVGTRAGHILLYREAGLALVREIVAHTSAVTAISLNAHYVCSASHDKHARVWATTNTTEAAVVSLLHPVPVNAVAILDLRVITGADDGKVRVWNLQTAVCVRVMRGNGSLDPILGLALHDQHALLISTATTLHLLVFDADPSKSPGLRPRSRALIDSAASTKSEKPNKAAMPRTFSGQWRTTEMLARRQSLMATQRLPSLASPGSPSPPSTAPTLSTSGSLSSLWGSPASSLAATTRSLPAPRARPLPRISINTEPDTID